MSRDRIRYQDIKWAKDIPRRTRYYLFKPADLADLFLHVNADNVVLNGGFVQTMTDLSGNGRDMTAGGDAADATKYPAILTGANGLNGHSVIDFDADFSITHGRWDNSTDYIAGDKIAYVVSDDLVGTVQFFIALDTSGPSSAVKIPPDEAAFWGPGVRSDFGGRVLKTANFALKALPFTLCLVINWDTGTNLETKVHSFVYDVLNNVNITPQDRYRINCAFREGTRLALAAVNGFSVANVNTDPPLRYYVNAWSRHIHRWNQGGVGIPDWWVNGRLAAIGDDDITGVHEGILNLQIGGRNSFPEAKGYFDGKLAEFIVYDRILTDTESLLIDEYFRNKYGLSSINF